MWSLTSLGSRYRPVLGRWCSRSWCRRPWASSAGQPDAGDAPAGAVPMETGRIRTVVVCVGVGVDGGSRHVNTMMAGEQGNILPLRWMWLGRDRGGGLAKERVGMFVTRICTSVLSSSSQMDTLFLFCPLVLCGTHNLVTLSPQTQGGADGGGGGSGASSPFLKGNRLPPSYSGL